MNKWKPVWYEAVLCFLMALAFVFSTRVHLNEGLYGTKDFNYIADLDWRALPQLIIVFALFLFLLYWIDRAGLSLVRGAERLTAGDKLTRSEQWLWILIMGAAWLPYYMSFYPGGVYADTLTSIQYLQSGILTNRHPFMYTQLLGIFLKGGNALGLDINRSMGFFTLFQLLCQGVTFLCLLRWMGRMSVPKPVRRITMAVLTFFPLFPLYGISVWKDTPFCYAMLLWSLWCTELYLHAKTRQPLRGVLIRYAAGSILVAFTRNNGQYVVLLSSLLILLILLKPLASAKRQMAAAGTLLGTALCILLLQGPGYRVLGVTQTNFNENLAIPMQQIASVVAHDGSITDEQKERLDHFIPYDQIAPHYSPLLADNIKWGTDMDEEWLDQHRGDFFSLWLELLVQNPKEYLNAWLLQTVGFWNVDTAAADSYVQTEVWNNPYGLYGTDYFEGLFGFSFSHWVIPRHYISSAWLIWIFLWASCFCMKHWGSRCGCIFLPVICVWGTVMIATPIAFSLRYVAAMMYCLPLVWLWPLVLNRTKPE